MFSICLKLVFFFFKKTKLTSGWSMITIQPKVTTDVDEGANPGGVVMAGIENANDPVLRTGSSWNNEVNIRASKKLLKATCYESCAG